MSIKDSWLERRNRETLSKNESVSLKGRLFIF